MEKERERGGRGKGKVKGLTNNEKERGEIRKKT